MSKAINFGFSTDRGDIFIVGELENPEYSEISIEEIYEKLVRNIDLIFSIKEYAHEIHYLDFIDGSDDFLNIHEVEFPLAKLLKIHFQSECLEEGISSELKFYDVSYFATGIGIPKKTRLSGFKFFNSSDVIDGDLVFVDGKMTYVRNRFLDNFDKALKKMVS